MSRVRAAAITVLVLSGFAHQAQASQIFSGTTSTTLSAAASFKLADTAGSPSQLIGLLTNTDSAPGAGAPKDSAAVLTGLFFNVGSGTLTPLSAPSIDASNTTGNSNRANYDGLSSFNGIELALVPTNWSERQGDDGFDNAALMEGVVQFVLTMPDGLTEDMVNDLLRRRRRF